VRVGSRIKTASDGGTGRGIRKVVRGKASAATEFVFAVVPVGVRHCWSGTSKSGLHTGTDEKAGVGKSDSDDVAVISREKMDRRMEREDSELNRVK
jgi:hypothetical protein